MNSSPNISINFGDVNINDTSDIEDFATRVKEVMVEAYRNIGLGCY